MRKICFFLISLFTVNLLLADISYENKTVADIKITIENPEPGSSFDAKSILSRLKTQKGNIFSQVDFDRDLKNLSEDFSKIQPSVDLENDQIYICIKLWLKPILRQIEWHGNEKFSNKKLSKELDVKLNEPFNQQTFNKGINKVKEFYIKKGYFESQVSYKISNITPNEINVDIFVKEGKSGKIKKIVFKGFTKKEKAELLSDIYTKKYNLLTSWLSGTGTYREEVLEQDKVGIINFLQNKGYADAKVDINVIEDKDSDKIIIEITAHRGTLYRFGKITYEGNEILSDEEVLRNFIIYPDDPFSPEKIRQTAQYIKDAYGAKGYAETQVYYETTLMENEPIYNVKFYIEEGEVYKIGLIKVFGNKSTTTNVILRESTLVPGEQFDCRKLKSTQARLERLGYFKSVNVYAVPSTDSSLGPNYKDIHIEVEETSTGNVSLAFGLSSSDSINGTLDLTENNFDHRGIFNVWSEGPSAFKGAGEYAQLKGTVGKKQKNYGITWMTPYFKDSLWRIGFDVNGTRSRLQSRDYKVHTYGGSIYASYPITNFLSYGIKYRIRHTNNIIRKNKTGKDKKIAIESAEANNEGLISAIGNFLTYDSTDNSYKPHRGYRSALEAEYVGVGGNYDFFKFAYSNAYYYPAWSRGTIKYRADFKFIATVHTLADQEVPLSERFFLGGVQDVRGYKPYIIGPRMPEKDDPKGGVSSMLLSIEYLQEIIKPLVDIFFFVDAGSVQFKEFTIDKVRASAGVGLRLEVMRRVPIIVGWGYPLNAKNHADQDRVFFSMGGQF